MKINKVSCDQFAGVRDLNVKFEEGLNVVYGKNESGKSTLVNIISRTLFQNSDLDGRRDKQFREAFFPSVPVGGRAITSIDGKIKFETEKGEYILTKIWGDGAYCTLNSPEGVIRRQDTVDEVLHEALGYGEGVYSEMLFSSQNNTHLSLQSILNAADDSKAKKELVDVVTKAFAESDGLSADAIDKAINQKISEIAGAYWDSASNLPRKKSGGGRWAKDLGEILKAYYSLEDAKAVLNQIKYLEQTVDMAAADYEKKNLQSEEAEQKYRNFDKYASSLAVRKVNLEKLDGLKKDISKYTEILSKWPEYEGQLKTATKLQTEKQKRELFDKYNEAKRIYESLEQLKAAQSKLSCPSVNEISGAKSAQRALDGLESKLCGMDIAATVKMLGGNSVEVTSLRTGQKLDLSGEKLSITEAVNINVPNVMEMRLAPADVDVNATECEIKKQKQIISAIFTKYGVDKVELLEDLAWKFGDNDRKIKTAEAQLNFSLGGTSFEELEKSAKSVPSDLRSKDDINADISKLTAGVDIVRFISAKETILDGYVKEYGDIERLKEKLRSAKDEHDKTQKSVQSESIPAEYLSISNPDNYKRILQSDLELKKKEREEALNRKTGAISKLDNYKDGLQGDPKEDYESAERNFNEQKTLLAHWQHILEVFQKEKAAITSNPMKDIADSFAKYLGIIAGGKVSSEFLKQDRLDMNIYSDKRPVDYVKLSEGTKETVSLAFRLAVLDHLFPRGGGVIILDDPLTDMDDERIASSCKLISECATRNQVIFLTCKDEYTRLLGGNTIKL